MRFAFTAEQQEFQNAVREVLAKLCPPDELRAAWSDPIGRSRGRWSSLASLGITGFLVPEVDGGLGKNEVDLVLLLEETGRAALPEPVVESALVAPKLISETGPAEWRDDWLPRLAGGDALIAVGLEGPGRYVADAHVADLLLLQDGNSLHGLARGDVELTSQPSVDGAQRYFVVGWTPSARTCLATGPEAADAMAAAFDRGAFGASAQLLGVAGRMIEMTAEYARHREQFGRPIGSFQAVKHLLADALLKLDFARPFVYRAAWSVAHAESDRSRHVSMAKAYASEAATRVARVALQVHGAIGYTWEHDLHLWMKRAWALSDAWGDPAWHRQRVATWLLGPAD